jgi:YidC/Oxa1 family membrane protein insertase
MTVLIRAVLVPLTFKQLKSMQDMQRLAPEINALKEKYKDDKQRQQQEIMKFYQEHKINPLASCLPLLLQLPVFISLFYMLRTDLKLDICGRQLKEHFHVFPYGPLPHIPSKELAATGCNQVAPGSAKFLFIPDITAKATGVALALLIVLYVGSQLASTFVATATADPKQRRLFLLLPVVFVVILYRYPAGLLVYWITTNLWTIGQQAVIRRRMPPPQAAQPEKGTANGKPSRTLKPALAGAGVAGAGSSPGGRAPPPDSSRAGSGEAPDSSLGRSSSQSRSSPPPRPPRKKKKRSGRRR